MYVGAYCQRTHGFGDIIRGVWRRIVPAIKMYAPRLIRAGANIVEGFACCKSWHDAVAQRIPEAIKTESNGETIHLGGKRRRKRVKRDVLS